MEREADALIAENISKKYVFLPPFPDALQGFGPKLADNLSACLMRTNIRP